MRRGANLPLRGGMLQVGLGWEMLPGNLPIDLDMSAVAVDRQGGVDLEETVYFGDLCNSNGSVRHTGDEREGDEDLGGGDDEIVTVNLDQVPHHVLALFFIATVAAPGRTFADIKSARVRAVDCRSGEELCRFIPALKGAHTALFVLRLARDKVGWVMTAAGVPVRQRARVG